MSRNAEIIAADAPPSASSLRRPASRVSYGSFVDPVGLAWRLFTAGSLGRAIIWHEALAKAISPFDYILQIGERRLRSATAPVDRPLLLVIGPPRAGTTLASQVLAGILDVSVVTNLNSMFPRSPLAAFKLMHRWEAVPSGAESLYGATRRLYDLNDGFHIWDEFLGHDRYRPTERMTQGQAARMRRFFGQWMAIAGKPLLSKNNRNLACAAELARELPTAIIICMSRDPVAMAGSLLQARRWVQGDVDAGWGLFSRDTSASGSEDAVDAVADQIGRILRCVDCQRSQVDSDRWLDVSYEEFCLRPIAVVENVVNMAPGLRLRSKRSLDDLPRLRPASRHVETDLRRRIEQRLSMPAALDSSAKRGT